MTSIPKNRRENRRGVSLISFVMMLFAVMAIAGMAVDMGLVFLSRRQMQTAVNTASLEGLRFAGMPNPNTGDDYGREAARNTVNAVFDSQGQIYSRTSGTENEVADVEFSGGIEFGVDGYKASQLMTIKGPWQTAQLKTNFDQQNTNGNHNLNHDGDIVRGQYLGDGLDHREGPTEDHPEFANYDRSDFLPESPNPDSVLVRMRRTLETGLSDGATVGSPVPMLFSRGAALLLKDPRSPLFKGIPVRAAAIAQWTPVMSIRFPVCFVNRDPTAVMPPSKQSFYDYKWIEGMGKALKGDPANNTQTQYIALLDTFWNDEQKWLPDIPDGVLPDSQQAVPNPGNALVVSKIVDADQTDDGVAKRNDDSLSVGNVCIVAPSAVPVLPQFTGLIPIVCADPNSTTRFQIVGFAYVKCSAGIVTRYSMDTSSNVQVAHAVANTSASFSILGDSPTTASDELNYAMSARAQLLGLPSTPYMLSASALVRTIGLPKPQN